MMRVSLRATTLFAVVVTAACGGGNRRHKVARRPQAPIGRPKPLLSRPVRT